MPASILVVEDETIIARDIRATLQSLGYDVPPPVANGEAALDAVANGSPDLVLMDIRIQGDMDGIDTAARIRELHGTPVIYLTSHSDQGTVGRAKSTGAYGYVLKPYGERELRIAIEVALEKRAIEQSLSERERWFSITLKSIGDGVIATDSEQRVTFMNTVAERITGFAYGDAVGKSLAEVLCLVDSATRAALPSPLDRAFREGVAVGLSRGALLAAKDGRSVAVDDSAAPIVDEKGRTLGGVVVFRDVTARRQLEEHVARGSRLAAIGTLAAGMAHEINNPLANILANVTFANEHLAGLKSWLRALSVTGAPAWAARAQEIAEALADACDASTRVHNIVHDLKTFARMDRGETSAISVGDALDTAIRLTENAFRQDAKVTREYRPIPLVQANEGQLAQVFVNLLANAADALAEVGTTRSVVLVSTYTSDAGEAVAEVRDFGAGISPDVQHKIFDAFFTTKPIGQGTGLGLSIAHSIVDGLGGHISLNSKVGEGTTFRVTLPPALVARTATPAVIPPTRRARILIIDDEPAIGKAFLRVLRRDHDAFCETDARVALSRVAAGEIFDVFVCDLMMPAMSGMEFFDALSIANPDAATRVVFLTGGAFSPTAEAFLRSTKNASLDKPVTAAVLRSVIAEQVARHDERH